MALIVPAAHAGVIPPGAALKCLHGPAGVLVARPAVVLPGDVVPLFRC